MFLKRTFVGLSSFLLLSQHCNSSESSPSSSSSCSGIQIELENANKQLNSYKQNISKLEEQTKIDFNLKSDELNSLNSLIQKIKNEKETCEKASETLFKTIKQIEEGSTNLKKDFSNCQKELTSLSLSSEALSSCKNQIEVKSNEVEKLTRKLTNYQTDILSLETKLKTQESSRHADLLTLQELMKVENSKFIKEKQSLLSKTNKVEEELIRVKAMLSKAAEDSYIFSLSQFKKTVSKMSTINKGVAMFVFESIKHNVPPTVVEDMISYYTNAKMTTLGLYKIHMQSHIESAKKFTTPHVQTLRNLYEENASKTVNSLTESSMAASQKILHQSQQQGGKYLTLANDWINENIFEPIFISHPSVKELVPVNAVDQAFAFSYIILILYILTSFTFILLRCFVSPLLRMSHTLLFCCCRKNNTVSSKKYKKGTSKIENSTKKDLNVKTTPIKQETPSTKKSPAAKKNH